MTTLDRLVKQLELRGLEIVRGERPGELKLTGQRSAMTPEVVECVKVFKPQILARLGWEVAGDNARPALGDSGGGLRDPGDAVGADAAPDPA